MKKIKVVAAIIENDEKEILCALRSPSMSIPNVWEFPGGKVEKEEDIFAALKREIAEELNCTIKNLQLFHENIHNYETFTIQLIAIKCKVTEGVPFSKEHSKIIWMQRKNLSSLIWAPADIPLVEKLMNELEGSSNLSNMEQG